MFILLFISIAVSAQKNHDTKIIVSPTDTTNLFNRVVLHLKKNGYTLHNKNERSGFILTKEKNLGQEATLLKVRIWVKGPKLIVYGFVGSYIQIIGTETPYFARVAYSGIKGSSMRIAWKELDAIAKSFGGNVTYLKK